MANGSYYRFPTGNPVVNALVIVAGALAIGASVVIGFFAMIVLGSAVLILAAIVGIRLWWFRWKLRRSGAFDEARKPSGFESMIEGEYTVIVEEERRNDSREG